MHSAITPPSQMMMMIIQSVVATPSNDQMNLSMQQQQQQQQHWGNHLHQIQHQGFRHRYPQQLQQQQQSTLPSTQLHVSSTPHTLSMSLESIQQAVVTTELIEEQLQVAKKLLHVGTVSTDPAVAEVALIQACSLLENWALCSDANDFDAALAASTMTDENGSKDPNPFHTLLAQAKHRLGQVHLLRGRQDLAGQLFLQVLLNDPGTLSPTALAMTWYDVGLIFLSARQWGRARASLEYAMAILQHRAVVVVDSIMEHCVYQAVNLVLLHLNGMPPPQMISLPWSFQFTYTTYNYADDPDLNAAGEPTTPDTSSRNTDVNHSYSHTANLHPSSGVSESAEDGDDAGYGFGARQDTRGDPFTDISNSDSPVMHRSVIEAIRKLLDPSRRHAGAA